MYEGLSMQLKLGTPRFRVSYIIKLGLFALSVAITCSAFTVYTAYHFSQENLLTGLKSQLRAIVAATAPHISVDIHDEIFYDPEFGLDGEEAFESIRLMLQQQRDIHQMPHGDGVSPLYTLRPSFDFEETGLLEFVVMTDPGPTRYHIIMI